MISPRHIATQADLSPFYTREYPQLFDYELAFTQRYRAVENEPPAAREAAMVAFQFPHILVPMQPGDLLAGRIAYPKVAVGPQAVGVGYSCPIRELTRDVGNGKYTGQSAEKARALIEFWQPRRTQTKVREAFPAWLQELMPSDEWAWEAGETFPLYRIAGLQFSYETLLELGIGGLREQIAARSPQPDGALAQGFHAALGVLVSSMRRYEQDIRARLTGQTLSVADRNAFAQVADDLEHLQTKAPTSFRQACQLMWLYSLHAGVWNYGRLDEDLGPFLAEDLDRGVLTEEAATVLLQSLFKLMHAYDNRFDNRVMVGGKGRQYEEDADRFAVLAMEAVLRNRLNQPQLSLRFYEGQNPVLYEKALEVIGAGCTFPILYNDERAVADVMKAHGLDEQTALQWLPYGCGETMILNQSVATPNAIINLPEILNRTLAYAVKKPKQAKTFDAFFDLYARRVDALMRAGAFVQKIQYDVVGQTLPFLFISLLYDDCLERGRGLLEGGVRYLSGTNETYGNITCSDALTAIKQRVYQKNKYTLAQLKKALDADFENAQALREDLLRAPKFGNDNEAADAMARRVHEQVCLSASSHAKEARLDHYLVVIINNWANTLLGRFTGATADGRKQGESLSNANNPSAGMDRSGTTAFLNSLLKLDSDVHAGSVQNMKFAPSLFGRDLPRLKALMGAYWKQGGSQAMITVVSRKDLEAAMREPEKWGHLMVRVGGFSMRFVELDRDVQLDILARTLNE